MVSSVTQLAMSMMQKYNNTTIIIKQFLQHNNSILSQIMSVCVVYTGNLHSIHTFDCAQVSTEACVGDEKNA